MLYTITPAQMRDMEREVMARVGMSSLLLMEHAALACLRALEEIAPAGSHVLFVCGPGNNGGDGCATARLWRQRGGRATVWLAAPPDSLLGDAGAQARLLRHCGAEIVPCAERVPQAPGDAVAIVDALFGTGLQRALEGNAAALVRAINAAELPVVAVDIASGIDGEDGQVRGEAVRAHTTVTFHRPKPGHYLYPGRAHAGRLIVADIGIRPEWEQVPGHRVLARGDIAALLPARPRTGHKGTFGHVLVVAGSRGMAGAATLCAEAVLRAGVGLVTVACPRGIVPIVQQRVPCAMAVGLEEEDGCIAASAAEALRKAAGGKDALAIGPGIGAGQGVAEALASLWALPVARVIDADALNALARADALPKFGERAVLTPHPGEMGRLLHMEIAAVIGDPVTAAKALAEKTGAVALLKGATTVIAEGGEGRALESCTFNLTGSDGMATGGSGDVLTGLIAGLLAQGMPGCDAASVAAWLHGRAGELCERWIGQRAMTATDLLAALPEALREAESPLIFE